MSIRMRSAECEDASGYKSDGRVSHRALLGGSEGEGAWDGEVGGPSAVPMAGGRYRLYYSGRPRSSGGVGDISSGEGSAARGSGRAWQGFGLALTPKEERQKAQRFEGLRTDFERLAQ